MSVTDEELAHWKECAHSNYSCLVLACEAALKVRRELCALSATRDQAAKALVMCGKLAEVSGDLLGALAKMIEIKAEEAIAAIEETSESEDTS